MNLTGRPPFQKSPKKQPAPDYLARVRSLPCCICEMFGMEQRTPTAAHHVIHGRYSGHKTPDQLAIPLCCAHHQTGDHGYIAIHREPALWQEKYGLDRAYTNPTRRALGLPPV